MLQYCKFSLRAVHFSLQMQVVRIQGLPVVDARQEHSWTA